MMPDIRPGASYVVLRVNRSPAPCWRGLIMWHRLSKNLEPILGLMSYSRTVSLRRREPRIGRWKLSGHPLQILAQRTLQVPAHDLRAPDYSSLTCVGCRLCIMEAAGGPLRLSPRVPAAPQAGKELRHQLPYSLRLRSRFARASGWAPGISSRHCASRSARVSL
jgi:hypothetical protein